MRSLLLTAIAAAAMAVAGTPAALAHGHHAHHATRHHSVHTERFGTAAQAGTRGASQTGSQTQPTAPTPAPATVTTFTGGILTITLADGSTVSGAVAVDTEIDCPAPIGASSQSADNGDQGDGHDGGGDQNGGGSDEGGNSQGADGQDGSDDQGDGNGQGANPACTPSALLAGTMLVGAELRVSSAGAIWEKVELAG